MLEYITKMKIIYLNFLTDKRNVYFVSVSILLKITKKKGVSGGRIVQINNAQCKIIIIIWRIILIWKKQTGIKNKKEVLLQNFQDL
jgi:hypothetical protein